MKSYAWLVPAGCCVMVADYLDGSLRAFLIGGLVGLAVSLGRSFA